MTLFLEKKKKKLTTYSKTHELNNKLIIIYSITKIKSCSFFTATDPLGPLLYN
jgi:hypothetical protein